MGPLSFVLEENLIGRPLATEMLSGLPERAYKDIHEELSLKLLSFEYHFYLCRHLGFESASIVSRNVEG